MELLLLQLRLELLVLSLCLIQIHLRLSNDRVALVQLLLVVLHLKDEQVVHALHDVRRIAKMLRDLIWQRLGCQRNRLDAFLAATNT